MDAECWVEHVRAYYRGVGFAREARNRQHAGGHEPVRPERVRDAVDAIQAVGLAFDATISEVGNGKMRMFLSDVMLDQETDGRGCLYSSVNP